MTVTNRENLNDGFNVGTWTKSTPPFSPPSIFVDPFAWDPWLLKRHQDCDASVKRRKNSMDRRNFMGVTNPDT